MTLQEFVDDIPCFQIEGIARHHAVYIAIMPSSERWEYDLEIEVSHDTIAGVYATGARTDNRGLKKARKMANELDAILTAKGIKVFRTREEWDEYEEAKDISEEFLKGVEEKTAALNAACDEITNGLRPVGTKSLQNPK